MADKFSFALLFGLLSLLIYHLPAMQDSPVLPTPPQNIGDRIPLPLAISATALRLRNPNSALLQLSSFSSRRRIHATPQPTYSPVPLHLPRPQPSPATTLSLPRTLLTAPTTLRLLAAPSLSTVFCPVPGTSATSLINHLSVSASLIPLSALALRDRERLLVHPDVFRFLFVAHPFIRALAAFYNGTSGSKGVSSNAYREFMSRVRGRRLGNTEHEVQMISLHFFLTFLSRQGPEELDIEFRSQSSLCGIGKVPFTFIGRMETFASDLQFVDSQLGLGAAVVQTDPFFLQAERNVTDVFRNPRFRTKASRIYGDDLRNFGYSPNKFS